MIKKLFQKNKKYTIADFEKEVVSSFFKEKMLDEILESGIDINWQNKEGESFLHLCAKKNLVLSMQWLLKNGIDNDLRTNNNETAVFYCVNSNSIKGVKLLISHGCDIDVLNIFQRTPLQEAVILNSTNVIDVLLENTKNIDNIDNNRRNVIFDAISNGNKPLISQILLQEDVNLNQKDVNGNTVLHQKSVINNDDLAIKLIEAGADPSIKDINGKSYLFYLARKGIESVGTLRKAVSLGHEINCTDKDNKTILMDTLLAHAHCETDEAKESMSKMIKELVDMGIDVNAKDNNGETALFVAVKLVDIEHTEFLVKNTDININEQNNDGNTPLSIAVIGGVDNIKLVLSLLNNGSTARIKDNNNQCVVEKLVTTSLDEYQKKEDDNAIFVLNVVLEKSDADVNDLNSQGQPPLFDVIFHQNKTMLKLFKKFGVSLDVIDLKGNNVIHDMIHRFRENKKFKKRDLSSILVFLITLGVDVNATDSADRTVLHNAIVEDWQDVVKQLLDYNANINALDERGRSLVHSCVWNNDIKNFKLLHSYDLKVLNIPDSYGILPINYAAFMGYKELVVEMIEAGSYINNTNEKHSKIVENLAKHSDNLDELIKDYDKKQVKRKISLLVENMKQEFSIT